MGLFKKKKKAPESKPAPVRINRHSALPTSKPLGAKSRQESVPLPEAEVEIGQDVIEDLRQKIAQIPPIPVVVHKVLQELANPKSSAKSVAQIAQTDPVLAATFLETINRAAYGLRHPVSDLERAIAILGYRTIQALLLQFGLGKILPKGGTERTYRTEDLWAHSLGVSLVVQVLAQKVPGAEIGEAATLGLLHDIGKFVVAGQIDEAIEERWVAMVEAGQSFSNVEADLFGSHHSEIGAALAKEWNLPENLVLGIRYHHDPMHPGLESLTSQAQQTVALVFLANQLTKHLHTYYDGQEIDEVPISLIEKAGLSGDFESLMTGQVRDSVTRAIRFVDMVSPAPLTSVQRLVGVRTVGELQSDLFLESLDLTDPLLDRIKVGPIETMAVQFLSERDSVRTDPVRANLDSLRAQTGSIDVTMAFGVTAEEVTSQLKEIDPFLEAIGLDRDRCFGVRFMMKYFLGNILSRGTKDQTLIRIRVGLEEELVQAIHPSLALDSFLDQPMDDLKRHRFHKAFLASAFGQVLTLGWFDRIESSESGSNIVLVRARS